MEELTILLDDGTGRNFDSHLKGSLPDGGDLKVITKDKGTVSGHPVVMFTFSVQMPDGTLRRAQTVVTMRLFITAMAALRGRYDGGDV